MNLNWITWRRFQNEITHFCIISVSEIVDESNLSSNVVLLNFSNNLGEFFSMSCWSLEQNIMGIRWRTTSFMWPWRMKSSFVLFYFWSNDLQSAALALFQLTSNILTTGPSNPSGCRLKWEWLMIVEQFGTSIYRDLWNWKLMISLWQWDFPPSLFVVQKSVQSWDHWSFPPPEIRMIIFPLSQIKPFHPLWTDYSELFRGSWLLIWMEKKLHWWKRRKLTKWPCFPVRKRWTSEGENWRLRSELTLLPTHTWDWVFTCAGVNLSTRTSLR